jgi:hypothetical protein
MQQLLSVSVLVTALTLAAASTISSNNDPRRLLQPLQVGQRVSANVELGKSVYFGIDLGSDLQFSRLEFRLEPCTLHGNPDLFVTVPPSDRTYAELPSSENFLWRSETAGVDVVTIFSSVGEFWVGVHGKTASAFVLSVTGIKGVTGA